MIKSEKDKETDREQRRLQRRRERDRANQARYRKSRKAKEQDTTNAVIKLKNDIHEMSIYMAMIAQGTLLRPTRYCLLRGNILDIYSSMFEYGAEIDRNSKLRKRQENFLAFNISDNLTLESLPEKGYKPFFQQCLLYKGLYEKLRLERLEIEILDPDASVLVLKQRAHLLITRKAIAALYPHMMCDQQFMAKAVGQELVYEFRFNVTFGPTNKIESIVSEHPYCEAWYKLLGDTTMVAKLLGQQNINNQAYITAEPQVINEIIKDATPPTEPIQNNQKETQVVRIKMSDILSDRPEESRAGVMTMSDILN